MKDTFRTVSAALDAQRTMEEYAQMQLDNEYHAKKEKEEEEAKQTAEQEMEKLEEELEEVQRQKEKESKDGEQHAVDGKKKRRLNHRTTLPKNWRRWKNIYLPKFLLLLGMVQSLKYRAL